ncbi:hypothetical protein DY000_02004813 [Brassica cretica]|uniref:Uncharacterized protein n=1 Tax=Brassica cretica TaxID=69181 RepID=A0ABQ7C349_BRACR|nr:hypothetical protein DY000_02004813 [Brassica cretica]
MLSGFRIASHRGAEANKEQDDDVGESKNVVSLCASVDPWNVSAVFLLRFLQKDHFLRKNRDKRGTASYALITLTQNLMLVIHASTLPKYPPNNKMDAKTIKELINLNKLPTQQFGSLFSTEAEPEIILRTLSETSQATTWKPVSIHRLSQTMTPASGFPSQAMTWNKEKRQQRSFNAHL